MHSHQAAWTGGLESDGGREKKNEGKKGKREDEDKRAEKGRKKMNQAFVIYPHALRQERIKIKNK